MTRQKTKPPSLQQAWKDAEFHLYLKSTLGELTAHQQDLALLYLQRLIKSRPSKKKGGQSVAPATQREVRAYFDAFMAAGYKA